MEAIKTISNKREGEYKIIKQNCIDVKEDFDIIGIADRFGLFDEDGETAYFSYGLCFNFDGEIDCIEVDKFIKGIEEKLEDNLTGDYWLIEKEYHEEFEEDLKKMKKYSGYYINL